MKESTVVKNIRLLLDRKYPGFYFKSHGSKFQIVGLPDLIGVHKGRFIGIEVKLPGKENTLTKIQQKRIRSINQAGGIAFMATSPEQVDIELSKYFKKGKKKNVKKEI